MEEIEKGNKINGRCINNIRYSDELVLIAHSVETLQLIVNRINSSGTKNEIIDGN